MNISRSHLEAHTFQNYSYIQFLDINPQVENSCSTNAWYLWSTEEILCWFVFFCTLLHESYLVQLLSFWCWCAQVQCFKPYRLFCFQSNAFLTLVSSFSSPTKCKGIWMSQPKSIIILEERRQHVYFNQAREEEYFLLGWWMPVGQAPYSSGWKPNVWKLQDSLPIRPYSSDASQQWWLVPPSKLPVALAAAWLRKLVIQV